MCFESYLRTYLFLPAFNRFMTQVMVIVIADFSYPLRQSFFGAGKQREAHVEPGNLTCQAPHGLLQGA